MAAIFPRIVLNYVTIPPPKLQNFHARLRLRLYTNNLFSLFDSATDQRANRFVYYAIRQERQAINVFINIYNWNMTASCCRNNNVRQQ